MTRYALPKSAADSTPSDGGVRLLVAGSNNPAGWGIGAVLAGDSARMVTGGPLVPGPWAYTYGLASVMTDDRRGTGWDIEQGRINGTVIDAVVGDVLSIDGTDYVVGLCPRRYVTLTAA